MFLLTAKEREKNVARMGVVYATSDRPEEKIWWG